MINLKYLIIKHFSTPHVTSCITFTVCSIQEIW